MSSELRPDDAKRVRDFLNHPAFEDMPHNCQTKAILASEAFDRLMATTAQHPAVDEITKKLANCVQRLGHMHNAETHENWYYMESMKELRECLALTSQTTAETKENK